MSQTNQNQTKGKREEITRVSIALALKRSFTITEEVPTARANTIVADFRESFDFYQDKKYWKNPISQIFGFYETEKAETFASAIIFYHGALPEITICYHTKTIGVSSPGYSC